MTDAHCHLGANDPDIREFLVGRDFVGIHPWETLDADACRVRETLAAQRQILLPDSRLGVGEIGLDRLKEREISPLMREVFEIQLRQALELGRPVVLHGAKCWGQVVAAIRQLAKEFPSARCRYLFHGFSRSDGLIPDIVALGGFISVGPAVLNDHAVNYRALVKKIPLANLLVETDRTESGGVGVREVLGKTAELRGLSPAELERVTDANAARFQSGDAAQF